MELAAGRASLVEKSCWSKAKLHSPTGCFQNAVNQFEYGSGNWKGLNGAERQKPLGIYFHKIFHLQKQ